MSMKDAYARADETRTADGRRPGQYPTFELAVLADDENDPTEYTVFPDDPDDLTSQWITAAAHVCVPLEGWL